ncbi:MAG: DUF1080 domain-containing protein [Opitutus sp.]|nr:DUF1080 domain-containing protein [Opitutus sp.]
MHTRYEAPGPTAGRPAPGDRRILPWLGLASLLLLPTFSRAEETGRGTARPILPGAPIVLFNGRDLSNFYTWLGKSGREDPDRVFSVVDRIDGAPALRISGQHLGALITTSDYADYRLVVEFRWGNITWRPRVERGRDSGLLLHGQGEDGNSNDPQFHSPWIRSVEFQLIEGGTGDLLLLGGYERGRSEQLYPRLTLSVTPGTRIWNPNGKPTEFERGRIDWSGRDPKWTDTLGFRGTADVENPLGQWNRVEAVCRGGDITCFVNGVKVNEGRNGTFTRGRILLQSEGAEIFFRRVELHPLE